MPVLVASRRRTRLSLDFPDALILDVTSRGAEPWITKLDITTMKGIKRTVRRLGPPLGHRLDGRLLGYEEARRLIYLPAYHWMLDHLGAELVTQLRGLASHQTVVLLDYTTNGDVTDLSTPLSHAAVVALYLLRVLLAPSETLRDLRRMVLDAAPVPEATPIRPVGGEPLACIGHDHGLQERESERPSEDEYASAGTLAAVDLNTASLLRPVFSATIEILASAFSTTSTNAMAQAGGLTLRGK